MGKRWIAYDWFKLIVLLILIALLLLVRGCSGHAGSLPAPVQDGSAQVDASATAAADAKAAVDTTATKAAADAAATEAKASADAAATKAAADAAAAAKAAADAAQPSATAEPAASNTGTEGAAQAPTADGTQAGAQNATAEQLSAACEKALPVRLSGIDVQARVTNATLTLRSGPEVANNVLGFMPVGSEVEVSALPVCTPYLTGANNWWQVKTAAGAVGFAAEGSAVNPVYYLEEIK